ncbi:Short-chain dehydrogenase/reductase 3 [Sparganum proliferum]
MFDGFKSRYPRIFPVQTKEATVARIIKAIRKRESIVYIPWSMTLLPIIKHLFPDRIVRFIYDTSGATTAMDNFTGRKTGTL